MLTIIEKISYIIKADKQYKKRKEKERRKNRKQDSTRNIQGKNKTKSKVSHFYEMMKEKKKRSRIYARKELSYFENFKT